MNRIILSLTILIILVTACTPQQTPTPIQTEAPTAVPTATIEILPTPTPTETPELVEPIMLITQGNMEEGLLTSLQTIPQQIPAWASRPAEDFSFDLLVFSKDEGAYQESTALMSVDNTAFVILRTQKSPENPDQILGDSTIRPLMIRTNVAGQATYFIPLQSEDDSITEQALVEAPTRDGEAISIFHLLDGTTLESTTASLTNPNEFFGKLAMATPIEKIKGQIEVDPTLGVVRARSEYKQPIYWNGSEWQILYESTSYEGIYSEKYPPTLQTGSFIAESFGIEMPINWGIAADVPVTQAEIKPLGKGLLGDLWLSACFYRYKEIMKNDVTKEQYVELVKNGDGHVEIMYFDEVSGEIKNHLIDPRDGVSITVNSNNKMPLNREPQLYPYPLHTYITINNQGLPIIVTELNKDFLNRRINSAGSLDGELSVLVFSNLFVAIEYFGINIPYQFSSGGDIRTTNYTNTYFSELLRNNPKYSIPWNSMRITDSESPFMKAIYAGK